MKVPSDEELKRQKQEPESQFIIMDQDTIDFYHSVFVDLANEKGSLCNDDGLYRYDLEPDNSEFAVSIDPLNTDSDIIAKVLAEVNKRRSTPRGYDPLFGKHVTDQRGKPKDILKLSQRLDFALIAYRGGKPFLSTAVNMGIDTRDKVQCDRAEKMVERYYKFAERLIEATVQGTFLEELSKPL